MKHKLFSFSVILAAILSLTACGSGESAADVNYSEIEASDGSLVFTTSSTPEISTEPSVEPIIPSSEIPEETSAVPTTEVTTVTSATETIVTVPAPEPSEYQELKVHFLDVGQGDSELIVTDTAAVLIDAGEQSAADDILADLQQYGITKLDWIIGTHPHADHIGGFPDILSYAAQNSDLTISNVMIPQLPDDMIPTTRTYEKFLDGVDENGLILTQATDITIDLGSASLEIRISPMSRAAFREPATPVLMIAVTSKRSARICTQRAALTLPTPLRTMTTGVPFNVPS